ncbi:MAG: ABC transporter permease [Syntrophales bacterium]
MANKKILGILNDQKVFILIIAFGLFMSLKSPFFFQYYNIVNIFSAMAIDGVIVIGMAYLIILGEIDLSVGSVMAFSGVLAIRLQQYGIVVGVLAGILAGLTIGLINGLLVTRLKLASMPVTLGMMVMVNGIVYALTKSETVKGTNPEFVKLSEPIFAGIPGYVLVFIFFLIVFQLILRRTVLGRNIYAVGGNIAASRFFGIKVNRVRTFGFMLTGFMAGVAGILIAAKLNVASGRIGINTPVSAIIAVLLGGVSLAGGEGSVWMAFYGIFLVALLNNSLVLLQISPFVQDMIRGFILIAILIIDAVKMEKAKYA